MFIGREWELKLSSAVNDLLLKGSFCFSLVIQWQVSWCTQFIVFNLHSLVAHQAADGESEMKTPCISSTDFTFPYKSDIRVSVSWTAQSRLNACSLQRQFRNMEALRGPACQHEQPRSLLFSQHEACTVFPAYSKVVFYHINWETECLRMQPPTVEQIRHVLRRCFPHLSS